MLEVSCESQLVGTTPELLTNGRRKRVCSLSLRPQEATPGPPVTAVTSDGLFF